MDGGLGLTFSVSDAVASHQVIQIVAIWPISAESFFVKQAFDAAAQANLVGAVMEAHRPAHFAVPATAENDHARRAQSGGDYAEPPSPSRLLFWFTHLRQSTVGDKNAP